VNRRQAAGCVKLAEAELRTAARRLVNEQMGRQRPDRLAHLEQRLDRMRTAVEVAQNKYMDADQ